MNERYAIIEATSAKDLVAQVNALGPGWTPVGGLQLYVEKVPTRSGFPPTDVLTFYQSVWLDDSQICGGPVGGFSMVNLVRLEQLEQFEIGERGGNDSPND